jgi:hypothetical protein
MGMSGIPEAQTRGLLPFTLVRKVANTDLGDWRTYPSSRSFVTLPVGNCGLNEIR